MSEPVVTPLAPEVTASITARFEVEHAAIMEGKSHGEALAAGREFARLEAQRNGKPSEALDLVNKTLDEVQESQGDAFFHRATDDFADANDLPAEVRAHLHAGNKVTGEEVRDAARWRDRHFADDAWVKKYLGGDVDARREMALCNTILAGNIVEAK